MTNNTTTLRTVAGQQGAMSDEPVAWTNRLSDPTTISPIETPEFDIPLYAAPQPALAVMGLDIARASESLAGMIADWYGNAPLPNARITADVIALRLARFASPPPSGEVAERMRAILTNGLKPSFVGGQLQIAIDDDVFSALAALSVAPATADGWRMVPVELTHEMVRQLYRGELDGYRAVWHDVLAAAHTGDAS